MGESDTILLSAIQNLQGDVRELRGDVGRLSEKVNAMSVNGCAKAGDHAALMARVSSLEAFRNRAMVVAGMIGAGTGFGSAGLIAAARALIGQ
jgi:2-keto-3-deoxy-galactonokinase